MCAYNFFVSGLKFTIFLFDGGWIAVDNTIYHLSIYWCVPEIFAVKVESFLTSYQILDVFALQNFKGTMPPKVVPHYHPNLETRQVAKYHVATPTTPKVIGVHLLKFKPIFDTPLKKM